MTGMERFDPPGSHAEEIAGPELGALLLHSLERLPLPLLWAGSSGRVLHANRAAREFLGQPPRRLQEIIAEPHPLKGVGPRLFAGRCGRHGGPFEVEVVGFRHDRRMLLIAAVHDRSERHNSDAQLWRVAYSDQLTGIPNATWGRLLLSEAIELAHHGGHEYAVLLLDIDNFREINHALGRHAGDRLLLELAADLRARLGEEGLLARMDADSFLVGTLRAQEAEPLARELQHALSRLRAVDGHRVCLSASCGIARYPQHGETVDRLFESAELALFHAKSGGRGGCAEFEPRLAESTRARHRLTAALGEALARGELALHYQPQYDLGSGALVGLEALLRWFSPELGQVPPGQFIPIAERDGRIVEIGAWVLRAAASQLRSWQRAGLPVVPVAVNVSSLQFRSPQFPGQVSAALAESELDPGLLELEITEGVLIACDAEQVVALLRRLRDQGIGIALDDFGTGYSSLAYLRRFALSKLKIDRSFINEVPAVTDACAIAETVIAMARALRLTVIGEGIENDSQLVYLREHGCQHGQGFLLGRPMEASAIETLLQGGVLDAAPRSC